MLLRYVLIRLISIVPVLLVISFLVFLATYLVPGDPARLILGPDAPEDRVEQVRREMGLDRPVLERYGIWLSRVVRGDLGESLYSRQPASLLLKRALPVTAQLTAYATLMALVVSIFTSLVAVLRQNSALSLVTSVGALAGISTPSFWLGIVLVYLFSVQLQWLPASGFAPLSEGLGANSRSLVLPALTLGLIMSAELMRYLRAGMLQVLSEDYVLMARAKGVPGWQIVGRTVLKNALIPFLTVLGLSLAQLVGGTIVIEEVFALPGMGRLGLYAVLNRDYVVVQAVVLTLASAFVLVNLAVDVLYAVIDPRIRLGYRGGIR